MVNATSLNHLKKLISENFNTGDFFLTLSFDDVTDLDEKKFSKTVNQYIKTLKLMYQNDGNEFKHILATHKASALGAVRIHAHIIIPKCDDENKILGCWSYGFATITKLHGHLCSLAQYMLEGPTLGENHKKRWCCSRNLKREVQYDRTHVS